MQKYKCHEDQYNGATFDFANALTQLKDGFRVHRLAWVGSDAKPTRYLYLEELNLTCLKSVIVICIKNDLKLWAPEQLDVLADDWVLSA